MPERAPQTLVPEAEDAAFMRMALAEAEKSRGETAPNPMVGAVVVRDGKVIGRGHHEHCGGPHAEVNALRDVFARGNNACGATVYVTLEPCSTFGRTPPCTELLKKCAVRRVVIGVLDPNPKHNGRAVAILTQAGIEVKANVERAACERLNWPFFHWITTRKPLVVLKMAETLDGRIADASGSSKWITGSEARLRVQFLRRTADAILVGAGTLRKDRPSLTLRQSDGTADPAHTLRRFVASTRLTRESAAALLSGGGDIEPVDLTTPEKWRDFLFRLGTENVMMLLIEGGASLAASAIAARAVDLYEFHIAPKLLGGNSISCLGNCGIPQLAEARELEFLETKCYGNDLAVLAREKGGFACSPASSNA